MKKIIKNTLFLTSCLLTVSLSSCVIFVPKPDPKPGDEENYKDNILADEARFTYHDVASAKDIPVTPSLGNVNIVVVPVQFKDLKPFNKSGMDALEATFNGTNSDNTNSYWESVKSFYYKSSYGKLNLNFDIADPYIPTNYTARDFLRSYDDQGGEVDKLISNITTYSSNLTLDGKVLDLSNKKYDSDGDQYVDGVWFIYNQFGANQVDAESFWAYTTNYLGEDNKYISKYANCAISFLYDGDKINGQDAHTIIHETGHMLGLDDYYSYDLNSGRQFGHVGGLDMMDVNIGDHDAFSKFSLGWIKPTVLLSKETELTLKPFESSGEAVIIPSNYYNNSAFSEYLVLIYYTPTGLNELDSSTKYQGYYPLNYSTSGILAFHVDARLIKTTIKIVGATYMTSYDSYLSVDSKTIPQRKVTSNTTMTYYDVDNSNTPSFNKSNEGSKNVSLISLLSPTNRNVYGSYEAASNSDLYTVLNRNYSNFSAYFPTNKFNDGSRFNVSFTISSLDEAEAKISVTR